MSLEALPAAPVSLFSMEALVSLLTLTALEIVLGIDNIIFISLIVERLPAEHRAKIRFLGLSMAFIGRVGLLLSISWLIRWKQPLFELFNHPFSGKDLTLLAGGIFLIFKSTKEIYLETEGVVEPGAPDQHFKIASRLFWVIFQIMLIDIVFSFDSVLTAVGLAQHIPIMVASILIAIIVMMVATEGVGAIIEKHPSLKMLALAFLLLIGVLLVCDGVGMHVPREYVYASLGFSIAVEWLNIRAHKRKPPFKPPIS